MHTPIEPASHDATCSRGRWWQGRWDNGSPHGPCRRCAALLERLRQVHEQRHAA